MLSNKKQTALSERPENRFQFELISTHIYPFYKVGKWQIPFSHCPLL